MGAWDIYAFDNDDGMDWFYDLEEKGVGLIRSAIVEVISFPKNDYLDSFDASKALAGIALVAAKRVPSLKQKLQDDVSKWLDQSNFNPESELIELSKQALGRIVGDNSELADLFEESDVSSQWIKYIKELKSAL